jgi:drug/metabolite transporter (DMT)-like permease
MTRRGAIDVALVVAVGASWGLLGPATKALFLAEPSAFDGVSVAVSRAVWSLPVFAIIGAVLYARERPRLDARRVLAVVGAGISFGIGITFVFSIAAAHTSIAHLSFLIGASPITNSAAAALVFRLPVGWREKTALVLGILGVALLAATHSGGTATLFGDGLMLLWLAAFAVYAVLLRSVGNAMSSALTMSCAGVVAALAVMVAGLFFPGSYRGFPHVADSPVTAAWFIGEMLIGATFVGQIGYAICVKRFGVSIATIGAEYTALTAGITASLLWHEPWSWLTLVAGAILVGALGVTFVGRPARETRAAAT